MRALGTRQSGLDLSQVDFQDLAEFGLVTYTVTYTLPVNMGTVNIQVVDSNGTDITNGSWTLTGPSVNATGTAGDTVNGGARRPSAGRTW